LRIAANLGRIGVVGVALEQQRPVSRSRSP
jgi:hypothetical protein